MLCCCFFLFFLVFFFFFFFGGGGGLRSHCLDCLDWIECVNITGRDGVG